MNPTLGNPGLAPSAKTPTSNLDTPRSLSPMGAYSQAPRTGAWTPPETILSTPHPTPAHSPAGTVAVGRAGLRALRRLSRLVPGAVGRNGWMS